MDGSHPRLLGSVFDLDMVMCPFCPRGSLRIMAAITQEVRMIRLRRHLQRAAVPPPIAPARLRQELGAFDEAHPSVAHRRGARRRSVMRSFAAVKSRLQSSPHPVVPRPSPPGTP